MASYTRVLQWVLIIAAAVVFVFAMLGPSSPFETIQDTLYGAKEYLPNVSVGAESISAKDALTDAEEKSLKSLQRAIASMSASPKTECYGKFTEFPELGEIKIRLAYGEEGTKMRVVAGPKGKHIITDFEKTFENVKPCIIAGDENQALAFVRKFIWKEIVTETPYFNHVEGITFSSSDGYFSDANILTVAGKEYDFDSQGWLFKADSGKEETTLCFFPTTSYSYCTWKKDGVTKQCFGPETIDNKEVPLCS